MLICAFSVCQAVAQGAALILDITAGGWQFGRNTAERLGLPYVHGQASIYPHVAAVDTLLQNRNATDAALVFSGEDGKRGDANAYGTL